MTALLNASASASQATELSLLVELEARWENLRGNRSANGGKEETTQLQQKQKAYEAFHDKLSAYNKNFEPEHVPERLLNTPLRLSEWCRKMRDLFARSAQSPKTPYPVHLFEKAYRSADRIADLLHKDHAPRTATSGGATEAVREFGSLADWCDSVSALQSPVGS
jgi:hypothetical protein